MPTKRPPLIKIYGSASKKLLMTHKLTLKDLEGNLMGFLRNLNFPIASSCQGDGVCRLCVVNEKVISCQVLVKDLPENEEGRRKVTISYL